MTVRAHIVAACLACGVAATTGAPSRAASAVIRVTWQDAAPLHSRLQAGGLTAAGFSAYIDRVHRSNLQRVREGDLDHLVFYALQSTRFTSASPIEPALSAKSFVQSLSEPERDVFLRTHEAPLSRVSPAVRRRFSEFLRALTSPGSDRRLMYFRDLVSSPLNLGGSEDGLLREYERVMRFVFEKEFVAQRSPDPADAVADLYRTRGLSTDTAVEAGYAVYLGLGVLKSLAPDRPIRRVLIVGPGLDIAPRTGLIEEGAPESYQPWAVIDALLALGLSRVGDLEVVGADINLWVIHHLNLARATPPALTLVSGIREDQNVQFSADYRAYFGQLGRAIGGAPAEAAIDTTGGHLRKTVRVRPEIAGALGAASLDIVTERLGGRPFDLIVATNILPYFDDTQLMLAMTNVGAMLAPRGVFLHNEARPMLSDVTNALGFPPEQSRQVTIATVRGAPAPLFDSIWLHRKIAAQPR